MRRSAEILHHAAESMLQRQRDRYRLWNRLAEHVSALAFTAGFTALRNAAAPVARTAESMSGVAEVLRETAVVTGDLEGYLAIMEDIADYSPSMTLMLEKLAGLALLLDFMCAREIEALCTGTSVGPVRRLQEFGDLPSEAVHQYNLMNAPPEIARIAVDNPDLRLLEVGGGNFVASIGDIDTSAAVATIVPGVGSSDPAGWHTQIDRARTVAQSTGAATVLWMGYNAPRSIPHALSGSPAGSAGADLREFHAGLARRNPDQRRVSIGYSYGSTVVGAASTGGHGLDSDAVVLVGSPGAGVLRAADMNLNSAEPRVYAVTGRADPIGFAATAFGGIHGVDPTTAPFGARVWDSGVGHSDYWNDPGFLANLRGVVAGQ